MEIHVLRDGKQIGPFTEETVQSLLKQGNILINDLAWSPGLNGWSPLHAVLYPAAQPPEAPEHAVPPPAPGEVESTEPPSPSEPPPPVAEELATPHQKAFLTFMAVPFNSDLSKNKAAKLVDGSTGNPKNSGRLKRWEEERFHLYPDLFADEIKARRENRSQQFLQICQGEGAEFFDGISKAHTQVLVGYLDVQYPTWDKSEHAAKYDYFFPAIAEKFPQLLKRNAKGRFKYPDGPKVAAELVRGPVVGRSKASRSPLAAIVRGIFIGGILLAVGFGVLKVQQQGGIEAIKAAIAKASKAGKTSSTKPAIGSEKTPVDSPSPALAPAPAPISTNTNKVAVAPAVTKPAPVAPPPPATPSLSAPPAVAPAPATVAPANQSMASNTTPSPGLPANVSLFDTTPPPAVPTPAEPALAVPIPATTTPAVPPQRVVTAKITKPTVVSLRFGTSTLRTGTPVQVLSSSGNSLTIKFGPETVVIPAANTDYSANLSMVPAPAGQ